MSLAVAIRHRFGGFALDVAFETGPGITALFGRSGAGKTTIVNAVSGLLRPEHGRVEVNGVTLLDTERGLSVPRHKRRIGYVFQEGRLFPHLTVRQNLLFGRWFTPKPQRYGELDQVVAMLGVEHLLERRPGLLSGGEKQRVAIGRALLSSPRLLLMDEPLASLDDARKGEIMPYIERLRDELAIPIVYVSHSVAEIVRLATTIVALAQGRVERIGPPGELMADPEGTPFMGGDEGGAVIEARVVGHDPADGLSELAFSGGRLLVPAIDLPPGATLRVRIRAHDVMLALAPPSGISALNAFACTVAAIGPTDRPTVDVQLACGGDVLLARITRRSFHALAIAPGKPVHAILKSVAVGRRDAGAPEPRQS